MFNTAHTESLTIIFITPTFMSPWVGAGFDLVDSSFWPIWSCCGATLIEDLNCDGKVSEFEPEPVVTELFCTPSICQRLYMAVVLL